MTKRILVPITHAEESRKALEYALSHMQDANITVIHVINPSVYYGEGGYIDERITNEEERRAEELLSTATELAESRGMSISTEILRGNPRRRIVEFADENEVEQIVMGSRGRSGIKRLLLGSVAESVLRRATVPVTIVR